MTVAVMNEVSLETSTTETSFWSGASIERYNFRQLNKTRIRFKVGLKKATLSSAPKWIDVLEATSESSESDLQKIKTSEVGLKGIKVFKALNEAASRLRQEIDAVQEWMSADNGDWVCPIDLAPLVWTQLINLRDVVAPQLRQELRLEYEAGYTDYAERIGQFLSAQAWKLSAQKQEQVKAEILLKFPDLEDLEDYLQVVIGRPTIIPALSEQLNDEQKNCLEQIQSFIQQYDATFEQRLREAALLGGEQLAGELLEELALWEPGRKPIQFRKRVEKHLKKVQILLSNASPNAESSLTSMMSQLEAVLDVANSAERRASSAANNELQAKMNSIRARLLIEQQELRNIADAEMGLQKSTVMNFKFR